MATATNTPSIYEVRATLEAMHLVLVLLLMRQEWPRGTQSRASCDTRRVAHGNASEAVSNKIMTDPPVSLLHVATQRATLLSDRNGSTAMARTTGYKTFGDCAIHGAAIENVFRTNLDDGSSANVCGACSKTRRVRADGAPSFVKTVMTNVRIVQIVNRNGYGATPRPCGGACTSGKRSCDCPCNGRCHGLGKCICAGE